VIAKKTLDINTHRGNNVPIQTHVVAHRYATNKCPADEMLSLTGMRLISVRQVNGGPYLLKRWGSFRAFGSNDKRMAMAHVAQRRGAGHHGKNGMNRPATPTIYTVAGLLVERAHSRTSNV